MDEHDLNRAVPDTFRGDHLATAVAVLADIGIDQVFTSGALDGVPIVGALTGTYRAGKEISGVMFMRKVARFLNDLNHLSQSDREAFADSLYARGDAQKFGEAILLLLEKADELEKPSLIARILVAHIRGNFDYSTFLRLSLIVNRSIFSDLAYLKNIVPGVQQNQTVAESLFSVGLLSNVGFDAGGADEIEPSGTRYCLNEFGETLVALL